MITPLGRRPGGLLLFQIRASNGHGIVNYFYCIINERSRRGVAIDPAWDADAIRGLFESQNAVLDGVLLTHSHADHVDLAPTLAQEFRCDVWMSAEEAEVYGFRCPRLRAVELERPLVLGTVPVEAWRTPGHTKGGVCYFIADSLFTGDTLFAEGCGMTAGPGASPVEMYRTLGELKVRLADADLIFPGHSYGLPPGQTFETVLKNNVYLQFTELDPFVRFRMRPAQKRLFAFK
jgi:glyoxylase-like metal-dependent hydrolase (beta-lactamase superfamily II)